MKKLFLSFALLTATIAVFAGTNANRAIAEKNVSVSIRSQIRVPEFLKEAAGEHDAAIFFKVDNSGEINIKDIQCDDADLKADLLEQTGNIRVNTAGLDTRDTYKVVIKFQVL